MQKRSDFIDGGPISIRLFVVDPNGGASQPQDIKDDKIQPHAILLTQKSGSSISTVSDFGFDAAPDPTSLQICDCNKPKVQGGLFDHYMDSHELQKHLHLPLDCQSNVIETVRQQIDRRLSWCNTPISQKPYLPITDFEALFCIETIKALINYSQQGLSKQALRDKIQQIQQVDQAESAPSRRRILGILTLMNTLHYIDQFIQEGVWDSDLPISIQGSSGVSAAFKDWEMNHKVLFKVYQEYFFVPYFDFQTDTLSSYRFDRDITLPWLEYTQKSVGSGGVVYQIAIHPSHHNFKGHTNPRKTQYFALKEIHASDRDVYKKELSALEKTFGKTQNDKHLIKLLLTFQHGDRFFLIFEWADGNLEEFWKRNGKIRNILDDRWIYTQFFGIATALKRIHGLSTWQIQKRKLKVPSDGSGCDYGRHGDIKASNILWFDTYEGSRNLLVLSDLGLTRYHSQSTRSRVRYSDLEGSTRKYEAPEVELQQNISSRYDIWSLGCVYLELFIWYFLGPESMERFNDQLERQTKSDTMNFMEDNFFNIEESTGGNKTAVVKPAVQEWTNKVLAHSNHTPFSHTMLDLITKHMLVVETKNRWKIDQICTEISMIIGLLPSIEEQPASEREQNVVLSERQIRDAKMQRRSHKRSQFEIESKSTMGDDVQHAQGPWDDTGVSRRSSSFTSSETQRPTKELYDFVEKTSQVIFSHQTT